MSRNKIPELESEVRKLMRLYWPEDVLLAVARALRERAEGHEIDAAEALYADRIVSAADTSIAFAEAYRKAGALVVAAATELDDGI